MEEAILYRWCLVSAISACLGLTVLTHAAMGATGNDGTTALETPAPQAAIGPHYAIPTTREHAGRIAVPVLINGKGPFRFLLDTGANRSAVTSRVAMALGLAVRPEGIVVQGVNGKVVVGAVNLSSLQLGSVVVGSQYLPVLDGEVFEGLDGSLGADLLGGLRISIDFIRDSVIVDEVHTRADPQVYGVIKARRVSGWLVMAEGWARAVPFRMVLDTGAARTLGNGALYRALTGRPLEHSSSLLVSVNDATQTRADGTEVSVSPIALGDLLIENTTVTFGSYPVFRVWGLERKPALLLGMDVLGALRELTIDYSRNELQVLTRMR